MWSAGGRRPKGETHLPECAPIEPSRASAAPADAVAAPPANKAPAKGAKRSLKRQRADRDGASAAAQPKKFKAEWNNGV